MTEPAAGLEDAQAWRSALGTCPALQRVVTFYETLSPQSLSGVGDVYAADARFRDPFNEVRGLQAISAIFADMFQRTQTPRFVITGAVWRGPQAFVTWDFSFGLSQRQLSIQGCSHLSFDVHGRVTDHRDYWDAAGELYERFPVIGTLMRALRRRLAAH
jgi:steroid Delta-isomerase